MQPRTIVRAVSDLELIVRPKELPMTARAYRFTADLASTLARADESLVLARQIEHSLAEIAQWERLWR
jgi:hypothetical protein